MFGNILKNCVDVAEFQSDNGSPCSTTNVRTSGVQIVEKIFSFFVIGCFLHFFFLLHVLLLNLLNPLEFNWHPLNLLPLCLRLIFTVPRARA